MSNLEDADYYADRANMERTLSHSTQDKRAAAAHTEMAERYEQLADQFRANRPRLHIVSKDGATAVNGNRGQGVSRR